MPSRMTLRIWGEAARSRADSSEIVGGVRLFFPLGIDHRSICSGRSPSRHPQFMIERNSEIRLWIVDCALPACFWIEQNTEMSARVMDREDRREKKSSRGLAWYISCLMVIEDLEQRRKCRSNSSLTEMDFRLFGALRRSSL